MSMNNLARLGAAAACLVSMPAFGSTTFQVAIGDPGMGAAVYSGPAPVTQGDGYAGSSAGRTLVTSYAQTNATDLLGVGYADSSALTRNTLDLSGLGASSVKLRYSLQVSGVDASYGTSVVASLWAIGYDNGFGHLVGLVGERSIDAAGVVMQGEFRYDGSGDPGVQISNRFYGHFNYDVVINPFDTPNPTIFAQSECTAGEAPGSGAYCGINFGFGIPPRPVVKQATLVNRFAGRDVPSTVGGVPEPGSWALLAAGFGIVGAASRRRSRSVVAA